MTAILLLFAKFVNNKWKLGMNSVIMSSCALQIEAVIAVITNFMIDNKGEK